MGEPLQADAWVATALGDPTRVLERQTVEVRPPGPNEVRVEVMPFGHIFRARRFAGPFDEGTGEFGRSLGPEEGVIGQHGARLLPGSHH